MAYFKIGNNDYSAIVNKLNINREVNYTSQTNASGNTVVDYINAKRTIEIGIIPLNDVEMLNLLADIEKFSVSISFRNPRTNTLETEVKCIIPTSNVEYYTIQAGNVMYNAMELTFIEL